MLQLENNSYYAALTMTCNFGAAPGNLMVLWGFWFCINAGRKPTYEAEACRHAGQSAIEPMTYLAPTTGVRASVWPSERS